MTKTHPGRRRKRGVQDEPDDKFLAWVIQAWSWAQEQSQLLILGIVALAVVIAASVYYVNYRHGLNQRATEQLESIHQTIGTGQTDAAKEQLDQFLEQFGDTDLALEARLLLGELHLKDGNAQLALGVLEGAGTSLARPLAIQVAFLRAEALEELERWQEAEEQYLAIAKASDLTFQINEALASAARIRTRLDDLQGAADLYERLLASMESDDPQRGVYELRLAEIRARMAA